METVCPTCKSVIDPTRASEARVRGSRVVTYCSVACADRGADLAVAMAVVAEPVVVVAEPVVAAASVPAPNASVEPSPPSSPPGPSASAAVAAETADRSPRVAERPATEPGDRKRPVAEDGDRPRPATRRGFGGERKWHIVAASSIALICGMGIVAIEACPSSTDVRAAADPETGAAGLTERPVAPAPVVERPGVDRDQLLARATATLQALIESPSPRLQRLAAMALARTGDAAAMVRLRSLMKESSSELVKLQIAYALARAGDEAGRNDLVAALAAHARDARLDGARYLAELGDDRATPVLRNLLDYRNFRISAAGLLARLGDPKGVEALREAVESKQSSMEIQMRAVVELGRAGDQTVRERLVEIQEGGQYQVGAALALAALDDHSAVSALDRLLSLDSFRVRAALGLRRMGETVELESLAAALAAGSDVTRVTAAEAILILTGPETVAEYD